MVPILELVPILGLVPNLEPWDRSRGPVLPSLFISFGLFVQRNIKYSFTSRPSASIFNLLLPLNLKMSLFTFNQSFSNHYAENLERLSKWEEEAGCRHGYDDKFHDLVSTINYQIH